MKLEANGIILRDLNVNDIDTMVEWFTVETEWMKWNGPWDYEDGYCFHEELFRTKKRKELYLF